MASKFDMRREPPQQQNVFSKRDEENNLRKQEAEDIIPSAVQSGTISSAIDDKIPCPLIHKDFSDFLLSIKQLTDNGVKSRLSRLRWVEDICEQSATFLASDIQTMYKSRPLIYQKAGSPHKAGNYYNALMLYFEYVHGEECPRINKKLL